MEFKTTLKSPEFDFVKKRFAYKFVECLQPQQNDQKITTRNTGINYNHNAFLPFLSIET